MAETATQRRLWKHRWAEPGSGHDRIVRRHLQTMARMNVDYDLLTWEGDILRLKFWAQAFEVLKEKKAIDKIQ